MSDNLFDGGIAWRRTIRYRHIAGARPIAGEVVVGFHGSHYVARCLVGETKEELVDRDHDLAFPLMGQHPESPELAEQRLLQELRTRIGRQGGEIEHHAEQVPETHPVIRIRGKLSENDTEIIRAFRKAFEELRTTRLWREGYRCKGQIKWHKDRGFYSDAELPDEDRLRSLLMAFRFFFLKKEPSYFPRVANIVRRATASPIAAKFVEGLKARWDGTLARQQMSIKFDDTELTPEYVIGLWFNAQYFHADEAKLLELKAIKDFVGEDFVKMLMLSAVTDALRAVESLFIAVQKLEL